MPIPIHTLSSSEDSDEDQCLDLAARIKKKRDASATDGSGYQKQCLPKVSYENILVDSDESSDADVSVVDDLKGESGSSSTQNKDGLTPSTLKSAFEEENKGAAFLQSSDKFSADEIYHSDRSDTTEVFGGLDTLDEDIVRNHSLEQTEESTGAASGPRKRGRKALNKDKELEKMRKERERELKREEREAKKREKQRLKDEKEREKLSKKCLKPGECLKYLKVCLDRTLIESVEGSVIIAGLAEMDVQYSVLQQDVSGSITFCRLDPLISQETLEPDVLIVLPCSDFIPLVKHQIYPDDEDYDTHNTRQDIGLVEQCKNWKKELDTNSLTLVIYGLNAFYKEQSKIKNRNYKAKFQNDLAKRAKMITKVQDEQVSRIDVESALVAAQLSERVNHRMCDEPSAVAHYVAMVTKAIAERPFKQALQGSSNFSWHAEGSNTNTVKIDKNGTGLLKLWHAQLRQLNNVGIETAQAIAREYGSPAQLMEAYSKLSEPEGAQLLSQILVRRGHGVLANSRKLGPELSRKIHILFTSEDPDRRLDEKE